MCDFKFSSKFQASAVLSVKYVSASLCQALATLCVGLPACAVPVAHMLNMAGEAMVTHRHPDAQATKATLLPRAWSAEDVRVLDDAPYYIFFAFRSWISAVVACTVCALFVAEWRGKKYVLGWPLALVAFWMVALTIGQLFRVWLLAEGHARPSQYHLCTAVTYALGIIASVSISLSGAGRGSLRRSVGPCLLMLVPALVIHWAIGIGYIVYFRSASFVSRLLCHIVLQILRVIGIEVSIYASGRIPDCPPHARVVVPWTINMVTLGAAQIMQVMSPNIWSTVLVFALLALSESCRHVRYLTKGETDLAVVKRICMRLRNCLCRRRKQGQFSNIVPVVPEPGDEQSSSDYAELPPSTSASADVQTRFSAASSTNVQSHAWAEDSMDADKQPSTAESTTETKIRRSATVVSTASTRCSAVESPTERITLCSALESTTEKIIRWSAVESPTEKITRWSAAESTTERITRCNAAESTTDSCPPRSQPITWMSEVVEEHSSAAETTNAAAQPRATDDVEKQPSTDESANEEIGRPSAAHSTDVVHQPHAADAQREDNVDKRSSTDESATEEIGRPSAAHSPDAVHQPNAADAKKEVLFNLVVATNLTQILIIATVATFSLIAKINPSHDESGPWPWQKTLCNTALALLFELISDSAAVFWAASNSHTTSELHRITSASPWTRETPWRNAALCLVAMFLALGTMVFLASNLCPRPRPGTNTLHVIGVCS